MSDEVLEAYTRHYIQSQPGPSVTFEWQGGEPSLVGIEFFQRADDDLAALAVQAIGNAPGAFAARVNGESQVLGERVFAGRKGLQITGHGR